MTGDSDVDRIATRGVMPNRIKARAPTRVDLAGGTIDIWPLYLLHDEPLTVNAAIDLYAKVEITGDPGGAIEVDSRDRDRRVRFASPAELAERANAAPPELEFVLRLTAHFLASGERACKITTDCTAPAGSGLGGSSSLGIALASALTRFVDRDLSNDQLLELTRAVETQVLRVPTGVQDYHAALRGGVLALHYTVEGTRVERLPVDPADLESHTVIVYTGVSRASATSNWDMMKRRLDGDLEVREALEAVNRATHAMRRALLSGAWDDVGAALAAEWEARKRLSASVTDDRIDRLIEVGRKAGAQAGKVCGAGGGGCLVFWARPDLTGAVRESLRSAGGRPLHAHFTLGGVEVEAHEGNSL